MSRASRRISKRKQKEQQVRNTAQQAAMKDKIHSLYADMEYAEVINTLADFIGDGGRDAEVYALGAWSYYRLGDYERAGKWVNVTLTEDPRNISVRILLAHLCLHDDRVDDALAVLAFILKRTDELSEQETDEIKGMLAYYGKHEAEMLQKEYPDCWAFLQKEQAKQSEMEPAASGGEKKSAQQILQELKEKVKQEDAEMPVKPLGEQDMDERPLMVSGEKDGRSDADFSAVETGEKTEERISMEEPAGQVRDAAARVHSLQEIIAEISQKPISLAEKMRLFHSFAGAAYWQRDYAGAKDLLMEALQIDGEDEATLRNLAYTLAALGEKEKAVAIAAKMKRADFALLWMLQQR